MQLYGSYQPLEPVGEPFDRVFSVIHMETGREGVLKIIPALEPARPPILEALRWQKELGESSPSSWAAVLDFGAFETGCYVVFEPLPDSLDSLLQDGFESTGVQLADLCQGILRALITLRDLAGRPHGNLRLSNVRLARTDGQIDFASPRLTDLRRTDEIGRSLIGSDQRALGMLLYQFATGAQWFSPLQRSLPAGERLFRGPPEDQESEWRRFIGELVAGEFDNQPLESLVESLAACLKKASSSAVEPQLAEEPDTSLTAEPTVTVLESLAHKDAEFETADAPVAALDNDASASPDSLEAEYPTDLDRQTTSVPGVSAPLGQEIQRPAQGGKRHQMLTGVVALVLVCGVIGGGLWFRRQGSRPLERQASEELPKPVERPKAEELPTTVERPRPVDLARVLTGWPPNLEAVERGIADFESRVKVSSLPADSRSLVSAPALRPDFDAITRRTAEVQRGAAEAGADENRLRVAAVGVLSDLKNLDEKRKAASEALAKAEEENKTKIEERKQNQAFAEAHSAFERGDYEQALKTSPQWSNLARFRDLRLQVETELRQLRQAEAAFRQGDYAAIPDAAQFPRKKPFLDVLIQAASERSALERALNQFKGGDYEFTVELGAKAFASKPPFVALLKSAGEEREAVVQLRRLETQKQPKELLDRLRGLSDATRAKEPFVKFRLWAEEQLKLAEIAAKATATAAEKRSEPDLKLRAELDKSVEVLEVWFKLKPPNAQIVYNGLPAKPLTGDIPNLPAFLGRIDNFQSLYRTNGWLDPERQARLNKLREEVSKRSR